MIRRSHAAAAACTLALVSLTAAPAAAQTGFEGVTTFLQHSKSDGKTTTMIQTSKGKKVRLEGFQSSGTMILDGDTHTMIIVEPEKKQYITITQADMEQMAAMMKPMAERMKAMKQEKGGDDKDDFKVDVSKTGRTETVAGTRCEVWQGSSVDADGKKREGEACVAQGVGFELYDLMMNNPMTAHMRGAAQAQLEKYKQLMSGGKGILKMTSIENGKPFVEMEATKIEKKSVSDDAFRPPAGYTGTTMGGMMQQATQQMQMMQQKMQNQKGETKP
jgi:hypothetical protein